MIDDLIRGGGMRSRVRTTGGDPRLLRTRHCGEACRAAKLEQDLEQQRKRDRAAEKRGKARRSSGASVGRKIR